jgi:hypothetical protein
VNIRRCRNEQIKILNCLENGINLIKKKCPGSESTDTENKQGERKLDMNRKARCFYSSHITTTRQPDKRAKNIITKKKPTKATYNSNPGPLGNAARRPSLYIRLPARRAMFGDR